MPAERIAMRQVRDVLRLNAAGVSGNEIARRVGVAPSTVRLTLKRLAAAGLGWPLPVAMTDAILEAQLFTAVGTKQGHRRRDEPDWAAVHRELKRKHVTLLILWDEYVAANPGGYSYSRYVAARLMLRSPRETAAFPGMSRNINPSFGPRDYRAFRNVISAGNGRCDGLVGRFEISTRASAFAFISISTSA